MTDSTDASCPIWERLFSNLENTPSHASLKSLSDMVMRQV